MFDTLVQRPFLQPTDLFYLLSDKFNETTSSYVDFVVLRIEAERHCRQKNYLIAPSIEDITLDEIYEELASTTCIPQEELEQLKKLEIELELFFCETRKSGKELFDIAKHAGKKVIITSDMYLPHDVIHQILDKNGYDGFEKLYVSSKTKLTKGRGTIYPFIANDLGITDSSQLLHIGDNWESDETSALNQGWQASYLPRASLIYKNEDRGIWAGETWSKVFRNSVGTQDLGMEIDYFPAMRNIIALSANKLFDNPFVSINHASDFNADPNIIGYSLLGPHLLALSQWIAKLAIERKIPTIHFASRDGFMVKQAFDRLNQTETKTNYIRLSRRALILADINSAKDLYSIRHKINMYSNTPNDFIVYLKPIIPLNKTNDEIAKCLSSHSLLIDRKFQNKMEYLRFIKVMIEEVIDMSLLPAYKEKLRKYFADIVSPGDYIFDIGYSGRSESALSNLLGFPIGSMYVHINSDVAKKRQQRYNCPCECFYGYKPKITGVMREHLIMELGPSTIGYIENNGKLEPLLETYQDEYYEPRGGLRFFCGGGVAGNGLVA